MSSFKKNLIALLQVVTILCTAHAILAQQSTKFEQVNNTYFTDGTATNRLHHFEHVFINDAELHDQFLLFDKSRRAQRTINHVGLGLVGIGVAGWLVASEKGDLARTPDSAIAAIIAGLVATPIMIISNIIIAPIKTKRKKNLLRSYESKHGAATSQRIDIGLSNNGLGLTWTF